MKSAKVKRPKPSPAPSETSSRTVKCFGFGFVPERSEHHFLVTLPKGRDQMVAFSEHFTWENSADKRELSVALGTEDHKVRVLLPLIKWEAIADEARAEFNLRLRKHGLKSGQWSKTETPVSRLLGKELVLLAWAIEEADPALIPTAIRNWKGLAPEERWWLYTMTNAATGHAISGRGKGWRKAVRYALTENPADLAENRREDVLTLLREVNDSESV